MNITFLIVQTILSLINLSGGIYLFYFLFKTRNELPYTNISSLWTRHIVMICILIQLVSFIFSYILYFSDYDFLYQSRGILRDFLENILLITIIVRTYSFSRLLAYNYDEISKQLMEENQTINFDYSYKNIQFTFIKFCLGFIAGFTVLFISLFVVGYNKYYDNTPKDNKYFFSVIIVIFLVGFLVFCNFIYRIIKYPLIQDKFKIYLEFYGLGLIFLIAFELKYILFILFDLNIENWSFIYDTLLNLLILALQGILAYYRNQYKMQYQSLFKQEFSSFIQKDVAFQVYKNYLYSKHSEDFKYLLFYSDFVVFKNLAIRTKEQVNRVMNERKEEILRNTERKSNEYLLEHEEQNSGYLSKSEATVVKKARQLFTDYFNNPDRSTIDASKEKTMYLLISFPVDIYEKIEELNNSNFETDNIESVFDDAANWALDKLDKIYEEFKNENNERKNIETIMFLIETLEVQF